MSDKLQLVVDPRQTKVIGHTGHPTRRSGLVQTTQIRVSFQAAIGRAADFLRVISCVSRIALLQN